jgi:hypothetical protein
MTVRDVLASGAGRHEVVFCCFSRGDLGVYERLLGEQ